MCSVQMDRVIRLSEGLSGGPGGGGVLEGPEATAPHPAVGPVEVLEETVPAVEDGWGIRRWRRTEAEVLEAEASLEAQASLEVLEASNLEGAAWRARWRLLIQ
ncbi:unnamed protein product [Boreogadus saida]